MEQKTKKVLLVINPLAGAGLNRTDAEKIIESISSQCADTEVFEFEPETALIPRKKLPENNDANLVISCGGDGTFNQVVSQYLKPGSLPYFAHIPLGYTNSFARANGIPFDTKDAVDTALNGRLAKRDAGMVNGRRFVFVASFASASSLNYVTSQQMKSVFEYAIHMLRAVGELHMNIGTSFHLKAETDNVPLDDEFIFGAISNLSSIDGDILSNDSFSNDDGKMELLLIKTPKDRAETVAVLDVLRNDSVDHPLIMTMKISKASFVTDSKIAWSLDGEFGGTSVESAVEVLKEALTVKVPKTE
ncbi:MAG: hypothetical protein K5869_07000 [Saccharofermentans sp.]|nr:hypothetical protein [Saccharofermentans sp.]